MPVYFVCLWTLLVGDQLDAHFFYVIRLFQSSTCFEQTRARHQEVNCINTVSGTVTLKASEWSNFFFISPVTGLEWPRGFQKVKVPRFHDNGTGRW